MLKFWSGSPTRRNTSILPRRLCTTWQISNSDHTSIIRSWSARRNSNKQDRAIRPDRQTIRHPNLVRRSCTFRSPSGSSRINARYYSSGPGITDISRDWQTRSWRVCQIIASPSNTCRRTRRGRSFIKK